MSISEKNKEEKKYLYSIKKQNIQKIQKTWYIKV